MAKISRNPPGHLGEEKTLTGAAYSFADIETNKSVKERVCAAKKRGESAVDAIEEKMNGEGEASERLQSYGLNLQKALLGKKKKFLHKKKSDL